LINFVELVELVNAIAREESDYSITIRVIGELDDFVEKMRPLLATPKCATLDIAQIDLALWLTHRAYSATDFDFFSKLTRAVGAPHGEWLKEIP